MPFSPIFECLLQDLSLEEMDLPGKEKLIAQVESIKLLEGKNQRQRGRPRKTESAAPIQSDRETDHDDKN